jgi:hypothetical protein
MRTTSMSALALICILPSAIAGTYYVDSINTSTNWALAANSDSPCTPSIAMSNARAGDTVYFRGGSFSVLCSHRDGEARRAGRPALCGTGGLPSRLAIARDQRRNRSACICRGLRRDSEAFNPGHRFFRTRSPVVDERRIPTPRAARSRQYFTEQPYGRVLLCATGRPAARSAIAAFT